MTQTTLLQQLQLTDSVLSTVGHAQDSQTPGESLKRALLNILNKAILEMETRFSRSNLDLMKAVNCLLPHSPSFLDVAMLSPLQRLTGSACSDFLMKFLLQKSCWKERSSPVDTDLAAICKHLQGFKAAFPELHHLYVTSLVIGVSSAA